METATINHQLLAKAGSSLSFVSGEIIFRTGDQGDKMYIVRSGEVEIELNGNVIETVAPGGFFGEMALIDGSPRVAIYALQKPPRRTKYALLYEPSPEQLRDASRSRCPFHCGVSGREIIRATEDMMSALGH